MGKLNKFTDIKDVIQNIFNEKKMPDLRIYRLKTKWIDIVGDQLSKHTSPLKIQNSNLFINCDHQGWINTLQFHKEIIKNNIKKYYNDEIAINDIKFVYNNKRN